MKKLLDEFKAFILTGNVIMAAVAFILGLATKQVIDAFVQNIINPIIGAIVGKPNFDELVLGIGNAEIRYGAFITALVNLVIVGAALFTMVKAYQAMEARRTVSGDEPEAVTEDIVLLREIRDALAARS